ncbi:MULTISPECIES: peptide deformylase [unclassified Adlercreutzia]|uniref:peptide deformylase n=1 Tax=unclassified Adlercreutzia TaxID=2636013 RepID=UPI0013EC7689|nr:MULTISPECIES: peptide deformylase [unclassified Adlercreutzia]
MSLKIVQSPDPSLLEVCEECVVGDRDLLKLGKQMAKIMYANNGCGIAAPQVGKKIRFVVIDVDWDGENASTRNPIFLVNPTVEELRGDKVVDKEACLSCPGISVPVARQPWARVRYFDLDGEEWEIEGDGLLGRCLQHEIDHLDGRTLFEACEPSVRIKAIQAYDKALAMGAKPGESMVEVEA